MNLNPHQRTAPTRLQIIVIALTLFMGLSYLHGATGVSQVLRRPIFHQHRVLAMCQVPDQMRMKNRCHSYNETSFLKRAQVNFQTRLEESSSSMRQLLDVHMKEFRALSQGLIMLARNDTLSRIQQQSQPASLMAIQGATKRLFDAMQAHLVSYPQLTGSQGDMLASRTGPIATNSASQLANSAASKPDQLTHEISTYFRRVHLIQLKHMLDAALASSAGHQQPNQLAKTLDLACLEQNLPHQRQVERVLEELASSGLERDGFVVVPSASGHHHLEQGRMTLAIRHSLEFARTLLGSLSLSHDLLMNLTRQSSEWMPGAACHSALAQMSLCPECHVSPAGPDSSPLLVDPPAPCKNYCLNVAQGCMSDLFELNRFWSDHLQALAHFQTNMIQLNNIENVMLSLPEQLAEYLDTIQRQYGLGSSPNGIISNNDSAATTTRSTTTSSSLQRGQTATPRGAPSKLQVPIEQLRLSSEMIKLCSHSEPATQTGASPSQANHLGFNLGSLLRLTRQPPLVAGQSASPSSSRLASKTLPATQQRPIERELMEAAQRARQSPDLSLFNRLHGLVLQLHKSRDFFLDWPQQVCNRIRGRHEPQLPRAVKLEPIGPTGANANGASHCWNGRDFSGYNKPLAAFGSNGSPNPEMAPIQQPISRIILDQVARLKDIGTRLSKLASRPASGSTLEYLSLTSKLRAKANLVAPSAEAQVSQTRNRDEEQQQQQPLRLTSGSVAGGVGGASELDEHEAVIASMVAENEAVGSTVGDRTDSDETSADGEAAEGEDDEEGDEVAADDGTLADPAAAVTADGHDNDEDEMDIPACMREDCSDLLTKVPESGAGSTTGHDSPYTPSSSGPSHHHHFASGQPSNAITTPGADLLYPPGSVVNINLIRQQQQQQLQQLQLQQASEHYPFDPQLPNTNTNNNNINYNNDYKLLHLPPAQSSSASPLVMVAQLNGLVCSLLTLLVAHLLLVPLAAPRRLRVRGAPTPLKAVV